MGEEADRLVERALFLMATGYAYTEERRSEGEKGEKIVRTRKQVPPNASAIALWLSHRMPERWGKRGGGGAGEQSAHPAGRSWRRGRRWSFSRSVRSSAGR